jgi:hypothetical protein
VLVLVCSNQYPVRSRTDREYPFDRDFRAPFRLLPGIQDGFNRKGLIDIEGNHKLAYDVLRTWYADHKAIQSAQAQQPTQAQQELHANNQTAQKV